jgi:hypothetical protein
MAGSRRPSVTPSMPGEACGQEAMLSRGYIVLALGKAAGPASVRTMLVLHGRHFGFDSRCGGFLYSAFAETFRAFRGKDFTTRLRWLFDLLKPRANAGGANHLIQNFKRSFHRDQSLKQKLKSFARG